MKKLLLIIQSIIYNKKNRMLLVILIIIILLSNIYSSNAYYHNESSFYIIKSKIGEIVFESDDYILLIYLEDSEQLNNYYLTDSIPIVGYTYSGYNCQNNSTLYYDDLTKITTISTNKREKCSIYFNLN